VIRIMSKGKLRSFGSFNSSQKKPIGSSIPTHIGTRAGKKTGKLLNALMVALVAQIF